MKTPLFNFSRAFKKVVCTLLANTIVLTTLSTPLQQAQAAPNQYTPTFRNECSVIDCAFQYPVPVDQWQEVATIFNPQGHRGKVDGREYYAGEQWMALGQHAAGVLGLSSAEVGLKAWVQPTIQPHPWVVARFLPERGELRINIIKNHKFPDGTQKVLVTDYTPQHGRWHVVRRMFRDKGENWSPYTRGIDPFYPKHSGAPSDPTFYNMNIAAAQVAVGQAMMHHQAPYAFFVETSLRLDQRQSTSGNLLRKKINTYHRGLRKAQGLPGRTLVDVHAAQQRYPFNDGCGLPPDHDVHTPGSTGLCRLCVGASRGGQHSQYRRGDLSQRRVQEQLDRRSIYAGDGCPDLGYGSDDCGDG
ncbi:MAG: hypothetical protein HEQ17_00220 [Limnohabitans sp.]|uniref:hypothetical protein n=1 Tax=Limnohabitans sp. TaxID=1907725 RepID=UPI0025F3AF57|nr:hypothetical protein [Limnohabitans sp.]MCO4087436.1 hypothetical protein [Limnohabitans sp.]